MSRQARHIGQRDVVGSRDWRRLTLILCGIAFLLTVSAGSCTQSATITDGYDAISPDGQLLITVDLDGTVNRWRYVGVGDPTEYVPRDSIHIMALDLTLPVVESKLYDPADWTRSSTFSIDPPSRVRGIIHLSGATFEIVLWDEREVLRCE